MPKDRDLERGGTGGQEGELRRGMIVTRSLGLTARALVVGAVVLSGAARAEPTTIGLIGAVSSTHWPIYIGLTQGYYAAVG